MNKYSLIMHADAHSFALYKKDVSTESTEACQAQPVPTESLTFKLCTADFNFPSYTVTGDDYIIVSKNKEARLILSSGFPQGTLKLPAEILSAADAEHEAYEFNFLLKTISLEWLYEIRSPNGIDLKDVRLISKTGLKFKREKLSDAAGDEIDAAFFFSENKEIPFRENFDDRISLVDEKGKVLVSSLPRPGPSHLSYPGFDDSHNFSPHARIPVYI